MPPAPWPIIYMPYPLADASQSAPLNPLVELALAPMLCCRVAVCAHAALFICYFYLSSPAEVPASVDAPFIPACLRLLPSCKPLWASPPPPRFPRSMPVCSWAGQRRSLHAAQSLVMHCSTVLSASRGHSKMVQQSGISHHSGRRRSVLGSTQHGRSTHVAAQGCTGPGLMPRPAGRCWGGGRRCWGLGGQPPAPYLPTALCPGPAPPA